MKIEVLGGYGGESIDCRMTCLLVNDGIALDAGSLSQALSIERQRQVHSIVLTHSHMDHTNSLPFFIENVFGVVRESIDVYASAATIYAIRKHLFNNDTWPDFTRLPNHLLPVMQFHELSAEMPVSIDGVRFTPIAVDHLIPTFGYRIEVGGRAKKARHVNFKVRRCRDSCLIVGELLVFSGERPPLHQQSPLRRKSSTYALHDPHGTARGFVTQRRNQHGAHDRRDYLPAVVLRRL